MRVSRERGVQRTDTEIPSKIEDQEVGGPEIVYDRLPPSPCPMVVPVFSGADAFMPVRRGPEEREATCRPAA